jgi:hypothetical protein
LGQEIRWVHIFNPGLETLQLEVSELGVLAYGLVEERRGEYPYRLHYTLLCDPEWKTKELKVELHGPPTKSLDIVSDGMGKWYNPMREPLPALDGCFDVDLPSAAFTNTIPIRRLGLAVGQTADIRVVYVNVPDIAMGVANQRYTLMESGPQGGTYRYENLTTGFGAEIKVDGEGLVLDYPGVFRRTTGKPPGGL